MVDDLRERLGSWMPRAWPKDTAAVTRWFELIVEAEIRGEQVLLLRKIIGWDESNLPDWLTTASQGRIKTKIKSYNEKKLGDVLSDFSSHEFENAFTEFRRIELPVSVWNDGLSAEALDLNIPLTIYELWTSPIIYSKSLSIWQELTDVEREVSGIKKALTGYLGSTIIIVPQIRPYFIDIYNFVIPGQIKSWGELYFVSEVYDGNVIISRSVNLLRIEPRRILDAQQRFKYLNIHYSDSYLSAMNNIKRDNIANALARYPEDAHGPSGSDWKLTIAGAAVSDVVDAGLIRGIGSSYLTKEPWRERSPAWGFSAPARVAHVAPVEDAAEAAFKQICNAGNPAAICDPYAESQYLVKIASILRGGRLLTTQKRVSKGYITEVWAKNYELSVRTAPKLHDRFIVGPKRGYLAGTSLNSIGTSHAFLVELNTTMQKIVQCVFDELWNHASPAW